MAVLAPAGVSGAGANDLAPAPTDSAPPTPPPATPRPVATNDFLPEDRGLSDCISAIPKPGCGSEARGGWRQTLVLVTILAGLTLIVWRIVVGARTARADQATRP